MQLFKKRIPLTVLIFSILITALLGRCGRRPEARATAQRNVLKFLDINVWSGLDYHGNLWMGEYESEETRERRYRALIRQIRGLDPDVIGIHEANKLPDYAERLATDLVYSVYHHVGVCGVCIGALGLPWNLREGDAVLAKRDLGLEDAGRLQLSGGYVGNFFTFHFDDATQVLAARITNRGKKLYVFVTHWHAGPGDTKEFRTKAREFKERLKADDKTHRAALDALKKHSGWRHEEAVKTIEFIRKTAGDAPFVLMGDFNTEANAPEIRYLVKNGLADAHQIANPGKPGHTWGPRTNLNQKKHYPDRHVKEATKRGDLVALLDEHDILTPRRIDFIFIPASAAASGRMKVRAGRVVLDEIVEGVHASDHYGVYAEIEFGD